MAYGVGNDKRYKDGNYTGIEALKQLKRLQRVYQNIKMFKVLQRTNEQLEEGYEKVVLNTLKKAGITIEHFSGGRLIVSKSDMADGKKAIQNELDIIKLAQLSLVNKKNMPAKMKYEQIKRS